MVIQQHSHQTQAGEGKYGAGHIHNTNANALRNMQYLYNKSEV